MDISALASVDELRGNPFVARAFTLFDSDSDGALSLQDFTKAIDVLGHLNNAEQQLMCKTHSSIPASHWCDMH